MDKIFIFSILFLFIGVAPAQYTLKLKWSFLYSSFQNHDYLFQNNFSFKKREIGMTSTISPHDLNSDKWTSVES